MASRVLKSCDVCGREDIPVRTYTIQFDSVTYIVDLDEEHAGPLLAVAEKGMKQEGTRTGPNTTSRLEGRIRGVPKNTDKD